MGEFTVRHMGPGTALVECGDHDPAQVSLALAEAGFAPGRSGVVDVVPAATTVLVDCVDPASLEAVLTGLGDLRAGVATGPSDTSTRVEVAVRFDGVDLDDVASEVGLTRSEVIQMVTAADYHVGFCGFAPGFAYLRGLHTRLHLPRREHPRTRVPAGSFAIASQFAAVYPSDSPGGWHLLGTTDAVVWSLDRDPPALLGPGTPVRIVAVP